MHFRRIVAITGWTLVAFVGCFLGLTLGLAILESVASRRGWIPLARWLPEWAIWGIFYGLFGVGPLVFSVGALLLSLRGKLPGTRTSPAAPRGFPMDSIPPGD